MRHQFHTALVYAIVWCVRCDVSRVGNGYYFHISNYGQECVCGFLEHIFVLFA